MKQILSILATAAFVASVASGAFAVDCMKGGTPMKGGAMSAMCAKGQTYVKGYKKKNGKKVKGYCKASPSKAAMKK